MTSFADLKKSSSATFEKLNQELSKLNTTQDKSDDNFWKPTVDKAGNGYAVLRFLPAPVGEEIPFVRLWDHGFQGPGGWYIENSLTTIGKEDPVGKLNGKLWNSGVEADKEIARKQKRRLHYIANIYIVKDPGNPANEGKVMLFKFGKKIFDKLNDMMNPQFEDEQPVNPFDLWSGANFKLKIREVEGYRNYDKSEFDTAGPLLDDDDKLEKIWKSEYSLQEFLDAKNFKSYEELERKLNKVLGNTLDIPTEKQQELIEKKLEAPKQKEAPATQTTEAAPWAEEEDDMDFFAKLADE